MNIIAKISEIARHTLGIVAATVLLAGCSGAGAIDDDIEVADYAADTQNYSESLEICNRLADNPDLALTDRQLGRLAIVYMKLADLSDEDDNVARATLCYRRGLEISADSLRDFYGSLSIDDTRHIDMLAKINRSLSSPRDVDELDTVDSTTIFSPDQLIP